MNHPQHLLVLLIASIIVAAVPAVAQQDLAVVYPATMTWSRSGLFPVCEPDDVWQLQSFEVAFNDELTLRCRDAVVAFGRHETNVLWAAVFPAEAAAIESSGPGDGEHAQTIFLRFAPGELGRVFPAETVIQRGGAQLRAQALRIARHKTVWRWSTPAGNPTVVPNGWCLIDASTVEGTRRFFAVNRNAGELTYVADFEDQLLPVSPAIDQAAALEAFDEVWQRFDAGYAGFGLLPELDWSALGEQQRARAAAARTVFDLAAVLADTLAHLEDLHVWVRAGEDWLPGYTRPRPLNGNWPATQARMRATQQLGRNCCWGRSEDGIGYLGIHGLGDRALAEQVDAALEELEDTRGLIVDLRFNGGGDELLGRSIAGRFVDEERTYALNQYRNGPRHDQLGPQQERVFGPRGPWRYAQPVITLIGQRTLSSAESLALMFAVCPQVTLLGDRTGGSSGNPQRIELECGITVNQPRWLDMDPEGNPIEHVGVQPDVAVAAEPASFDDGHDPVLEAALERLRR